MGDVLEEEDGGLQGVRAMEKLLAVSSAPGAGPALRPVAVAGGVRGYNADAPLLRYERDDLGEDSRRGAHDVAVPNFFSDVFADPVSALQNLGRLLSLMDGMVSPAGRLAAAVWVELQGGRGGAAPEDGHVGPGEGTREGLGIAEQPANQGRGQEGSCTSILHPSLNNYQCISLGEPGRVISILDLFLYVLNKGLLDPSNLSPITCSMVVAVFTMILYSNSC